MATIDELKLYFALKGDSPNWAEVNELLENTIDGRKGTATVATFPDQPKNGDVWDVLPDTGPYPGFGNLSVPKKEGTQYVAMPYFKRENDAWTLKRILVDGFVATDYLQTAALVKGSQVAPASANLFDSALFVADVFFATSGGSAGKLAAGTGWLSIFLPVTIQPYWIGRFNTSTGLTYGFFTTSPVVGSSSIKENAGNADYTTQVIATGATKQITPPATTAVFVLSFKRPADAATVYAQGTINTGSELLTPYAPKYTYGIDKVGADPIVASGLAKNNWTPDPENDYNSLNLKKAKELFPLRGEALNTADFTLSGTNILGLPTGANTWIAISNTFISSAGALLTGVVGNNDWTGSITYRIKLDPTKTRIYYRDIALRPAVTGSAGYLRLLDVNANYIANTVAGFASNANSYVDYGANAAYLDITVKGPTDAVTVYANAKIGFEAFRITKLKNYDLAGAGAAELPQDLSKTGNVEFNDVKVHSLTTDGLALNIPSTLAATSINGIWYDPADGNRLKLRTV